MPHLDFKIFIPLLTAHLVVDFYLQSDEQVHNKRKPSVFVFHILMVGIATYVLLGDWTAWLAPVIVMASHALIDWLKLVVSPKWIVDLRAFVIDQLLHLGMLYGIAVVINEYMDYKGWWGHPSQDPYLFILLILSGVILVTKAGGILIQKTLNTILEEKRSQEGLPKGGRYIGYLERLLLLMFIMLGQVTAIGFLVAAKSIFRFGEMKENQQGKAEYILVGTLLSFTVGISFAIAVKGMWDRL